MKIDALTTEGVLCYPCERALLDAIDHIEGIGQGAGVAEVSASQSPVGLATGSTVSQPVDLRRRG